jgi:hypothetical protein
VTAPYIDPLADYTSDWRSRRGRASTDDDPLADYTPAWRGQQATARAMFGAPEPTTVDPGTLAGVQSTAAEGVAEGPFSRALHRVGRVGGQLAGSLGDQAAMIAGGAVGGGELLAGQPIDIARMDARRVADPIFAAMTELVGEPRGLIEKGARLVGPLPFVGGAKALARGLEGRAARTAARIAETEAAAVPSELAAADPLASYSPQWRETLGEGLGGAPAKALPEIAPEIRKPAPVEAPPALAVSHETPPVLEKPVASAIRDRTDPDRIFTGQLHPDAEAAAHAAGVPEHEIEGFEQGFVTASREFLTRRQATERVGMNPEAGGLDASYFEVERGGAKPPPAAGPFTAALTKRMQKLSDDAILSRYEEVATRMGAASERAGKETQQWTRYDPNVDASRSGTVISPRGGRAIGRVKDDGRILAELEGEWVRRGHDPADLLRAAKGPPVPDEVVERQGIESESGAGLAPRFDPSELGIARPSLLGGITGTAGGAVGGAQVDEEHPVRGALLGAVAGGLLGAGAGRLLERGPGGAIARNLANRRGAVAIRPEKASDQAILDAITEARAPSPTTGPINPDEFVNVAKFALDETGEQRLRAEVTRVVQTHGIAPKQRLTHEQTRRMAADIGLKDLPTEQLNTRLNGPQMLAIRNIVSTNVTKLESLYGRLKGGGLTPDEIKSVDQGIGYLERENDALLSRFTRARTQTGRDLNNLKILANRVMDPFTWITKAQNIVGGQGGKLAPEQIQRITELVNGGDRIGLVQYVAGLRTSSKMEQAVSLWKTGLLTNPKTHLANMIGNTAMLGLETAKDLPAALVDRLLSVGTKVRSKSFSPFGTAKATFKGAIEGVREARAVMRGVPTERDLARWDLPREVTFQNPVLRAYTQVVSRALRAEDRVFYKAALKRSLAEGQRLQPGPVTEEMALQAVADAEYAVFQNNSMLARAGSGFRRPLGAVGHVVAPFTQTPGNVVMAALDYSPFGAIRTGRDLFRLVKQARAGASPTELRALQKATSESAGRTATGTAPFLAGYLLARAGKMTGTRPERKEERDQWELEGKQENALHIGGKYYSLNRVSPVGNLMALGANYYALTQEPGASPLGAAAAALGSVGTTATEQSFLSGVQDVSEAIKNPKQAAGRYATNLAGSIVPAAVGAAARASDRTMRDVQGPLDAIKAKLPGLSETLPAKVTALGEPKQRTGPPAGEFFDPTTAKTEQRNDPVIRELADLGISLGELGQGRPNAATAEKWRALLPKTGGARARAYIERQISKAEKGEDRPAYLIRATSEGRTLHRILSGLIAEPKYQQLAPEGRREILERAIDYVRRQQAQRRKTPAVR